MIAPTNDLLDLIRTGIHTKNERADTAARELLSYIVFHSLTEFQTEVPDELIERVVILNLVVANPAEFPQDMFDEEEEDGEEQGPSSGVVPPDDGPLLA